ncbi:MAG TPA: FtsX-like permease family protein, partial [Gemmatimonadales bacterium]|nr:FtsX-like permease family protein [Gemmatimonadales bacterium]
VGERQRPWRTGATMFLVLGGLALLVAAIGLYSVIAYNVAQRTHELGVRIALGARLQDVVRLVLGDGLRLAAGGIAAGTLLALLAGPMIGALLFQESPRDPFVYAFVTLVLLVAGIGASLVPGFRAGRVDPNIALRAE